MNNTMALHRKLGIMLLLAAVVGSIVLASIRSGVVDRSPEALLLVLQQQSWIPWVYAAFLAASSVIVLPSTPVTLMLGTVYGWPVLPYNLLGFVVGLFLGRLALRAGMRGSQAAAASRQDFAVWQARVERNAFLAAGGLRLIPGMTFALQNALLAVFKVPWIPYILGSLAVIMPFQVVLVWGGLQSRDALAVLPTLFEKGWIVQGACAVLGLWLWSGLGVERLVHLSARLARRIRPQPRA